jgi:hypothetical protein
MSDEKKPDGFGLRVAMGRFGLPMGQSRDLMIHELREFHFGRGRHKLTTAVDCSEPQPHSWYETENTVRFDGPRLRDRVVFENPPRPWPEPPYGGRYARGR